MGSSVATPGTASTERALRVAEEIATAKDRPMLLPVGYDDFSVPKLRHFTTENLQAVAGRQALVWAATFRKPGIKVPAGDVGSVIGDHGRVLNLMVDGGPEPLVRYLQGRLGRPIILYGLVERRGGTWYLIDPEPLPAGWVGRIRPRYPLDGRTVRAQSRRVEDLAADSYLANVRAQNIRRKAIEARMEPLITEAIGELMLDGLKHRNNMLAAVGRSRVGEVKTALRHLLRSAHAPASMKEARSAMRFLQHIAAVCMLREGVENAYKEARTRQRVKMDAPKLAEQFLRRPRDEVLADLCAHYPYQLSEEQKAAAWACLQDYDGSKVARRLISGDVGTGKTDVIGVAARAMALSGHQVAVLCPTANLAQQTFEKMLRWNPDLECSVVTSTGEKASPAAMIQVGTLSLARSGVDYALVVCDEQQRFSRIQREQLLKTDGHLLEATATCIPRSQAMIEMGSIDVSRLKTCHVDKQIETRIWEESERLELFEQVEKTVAKQRKVLVFYPAIGEELGAAEREAGVKFYSVEGFKAQWNARFPGRVGVVHSALKKDEVEEVLRRLKAGELDIVLTTTMLEMGLDVASIERVVVVEAQRFGLTTLHQIRGRVARDGGRGFCDLYLVGEVKPVALRRMEVIRSCKDGFEIARRDAALRGSGDVSEHGQRQKGALPGNPFINFEVPAFAIDRAAVSLHKAWFGTSPAPK